jgi:hypothetical protein
MAVVQVGESVDSLSYRLPQLPSPPIHPLYIPSSHNPCHTMGIRHFLSGCKRLFSCAIWNKGTVGLRCLRTRQRLRLRLRLPSLPCMQLTYTHGCGCRRCRCGCGCGVGCSRRGQLLRLRRVARSHQQHRLLVAVVAVAPWSAVAVAPIHTWLRYALAVAVLVLVLVAVLVAVCSRRRCRLPWSLTIIYIHNAIYYIYTPTQHQHNNINNIHQYQLLTTTPAIYRCCERSATAGNGALCARDTPQLTTAHYVRTMCDIRQRRTMCALCARDRRNS